MGYASTLTQAGFALQAKLFAEGGDLHITRVAVGSGVPPEGTDLTELTGLFHEVARATSTTPIRRGCAVDFWIEYRPDLAPEITEAFLITEYGVFGLGAGGEERLLFYGDVSHFPETAVPARYGGSVRRYPVHVEIGSKAGAVLDYPAGAWCTYEDMATLANALAIRQIGIEIPAAGWVKESLGGYPYRLTLPVEDVTEDMIPSVTVLPEGEAPAVACGLAPFANTVEGGVVFAANTPPGGKIPARLTLLRDSTGLVLSTQGGSQSLPVASETTPGIVKPGPGLLVDTDGTLRVNTATDEEFRALLDREEGA